MEAFRKSLLEKEEVEWRLQIHAIWIKEEANHTKFFNNMLEIRNFEHHMEYEVNLLVICPIFFGHFKGGGYAF